MNMEQNQISQWRKLYSFPLGTLLVAIAGIFVLGFVFGIVGTTPSEKEEAISPTPTFTPVPTKQPISQAPQNTSALKQQLKDCQSVVRLEADALGLSSEIISISGNVILSIANGDIDVLEIEKGTVRVEAINKKISQLESEMTPLTEKCFKE